MTTRSKRRRGRPSSRHELPPVELGAELPPPPIPTSGSSDPDAARQALAAAELPPEPPEPSFPLPDGPEPQAPSRVDAGDPARPRAPPIASVPIPKPAPANGNGKTPHKVQSLSGRQYRGVKVEQLRTLLAKSENDRAELAAQLREAAPIVEAATDETLAKACGATLAMVADVAAIFYGPKARITPEQTKQLGDAWAPALRPYLGSAAQHAPLLAAIAVTSGIAFEKYWTIRAEREAQAAAARELTR